MKTDKMVSVSFHQAGVEMLALDIAYGQQVEIRGDVSWFDWNFTPTSTKYQRPISFYEDAEEWARSLPAAYAHSAIQASIIADGLASQQTPVRQQLATPALFPEPLSRVENQQTQKQILERLKSSVILAIFGLIVVLIYHYTIHHYLINHYSTKNWGDGFDIFAWVPLIVGVGRIIWALIQLEEVTRRQTADME